MMYDMNPVEPQPKKTREVSFLTWKFALWLTRVTMYAAICALVADVTIWALSFATPHVVMPDWVFAPFFAFAIASGGIAVLTWSRSHGWPRTKVPISFKQFNGTQRVVLVALFALSVVAAITSDATLITGVPGQPGYNAATHQYYFDSHGSVTITTRARFLAAVALQTRAFISFAMLFTFAAVLILSGEYRARRSVEVPSISALTLPANDAPRWSVRALPGATLVVLASVIAVVGMSGIVGRVDRYLAAPRDVTVSGITQYLSAGPKVVFVFCKTNAMDASYDCPSVTPSDIVINSRANGATLSTYFDPSTDHISPRELPAVGQLVLHVPAPGEYRIRLTRPIAKGVFVAESPGVIARSAAGSILLTVLGIAGLVVGIVLLIRRLRWRASSALPVEMPLNWPPAT